MAKKNNKDTRLGFEFSEFYLDKLNIEGKKIHFGTNVRLDELLTLLGKTEADIKKNTEIEATGHAILDDDQIAEIAMAFDYEFEKVDDVSEENVLSKITDLVESKE